MEKNKFIELATKYLSNEATFEEKEQLNELLKDEKYNEMFVWISNNWQNFGLQKNVHNFNVERGLHKLTQKIRAYEPEFDWDENKKSRFGSINSLLKIAASIAIFLLISILAFYQLTTNTNDKVPITLTTKSTLSGQKSIVTLFDGTKVILNAESKFKYPPKFGDFSREVYLEGEAFFEVAHNSKKPFIVHTGKLSTKVLGTKFNVSAFPTENDIKISLVEGKVVVLKETPKKGTEKIKLLPHQQFIYDTKTKSGKVERFNIVKETGWKDNKYIFDNESLNKALVKLSRAFGVEFKLDIPQKDKYKIKANFNNESFWTIVEAIKYATKLNYKIVSKNNEVEKVIFNK